jgi:hypothetical protein
LRLFSKDIDFGREQKAPLHKNTNVFRGLQATKRAKAGLSDLNPHLAGNTCCEGLMGETTKSLIFAAATTKPACKP